MEFSSINLNEVGTKAQSKSELYRLLTVEGGIYLPPQEQTSMDFVSDICFKDKRALKASEVNVCSVPHVKGLRSKNLIRFLVEECDAELYLPANYMRYTPNRTFLGNLCNSINPEGFQQKMKEELNRRETKLLEERNLSVNISSDIADIFRTSQIVTVSRGKSHKLLRKNLIRKQREAEKLKQKELERAAKNSEKLKEQVEYLKEIIEDREKHIDALVSDSQILKSLFSQGIIDADGNPLNM